MRHPFGRSNNLCVKAYFDQPGSQVWCILGHHRFEAAPENGLIAIERVADPALRRPERIQEAVVHVQDVDAGIGGGGSLGPTGG